MPLIILERAFEQPLSVADFTGASKTLAPCLDVRGIKWLGSTLSLDGKRAMCRYDAVDAESVRAANREANLPFEHVWAAQELKP